MTPRPASPPPPALILFLPRAWSRAECAAALDAACRLAYPHTCACGAPAVLRTCAPQGFDPLEPAPIRDDGAPLTPADIIPGRSYCVDHGAGVVARVRRMAPPSVRLVYQTRGTMARRLNAPQDVAEIGVKHAEGR